MGTGDLCRVPPAAVRHEESGKVQGRDRVGIVEKFWVLLSPLPRGGLFGENSFQCAQGVNGHRSSVSGAPPPPAARRGRARRSSGTGPCGDCRRVLSVPSPWGQYSGKIRFI